MSPRCVFFVFLLAPLVLSACLERGAAPAPVTDLGTRLESSAGVAQVLPGDTLWRISQRYRLPLRDIISLNGLAPPYPVTPGQRLKLPSPVDYRAGPDDTLHRVARMFGAPVSQLVRVNGIPAPYHLRAGQVLRIPRSSIPPVPSPKTLVAAVPPPPFRAVAEEAGQAATGRLVWPVRGRVVSGYGPKDGKLYNDGINIAAPRGTPVVAADGGTVVYVGDALSGYGNLVLIRHGGGLATAYAHLSSVGVKRGMQVRQGQVIGAAGATGSVDTPQLHFEVRRGKETLDPRKVLTG